MCLEFSFEDPPEITMPPHRLCGDCGGIYLSLTNPDPDDPDVHGYCLSPQADMQKALEEHREIQRLAKEDFKCRS